MSDGTSGMERMAGVGPVTYSIKHHIHIEAAFLV